MKKNSSILLGFLILICLTGCGKGASETEIAASTIFTPRLAQQLDAITLYPADTGITIERQEDREEIFQLLSQLTLTETTEKEAGVDGGIRIELETKDSTLQIQVTKETLSVNDHIYYTDREILSDITELSEAYSSR